MKRKSLAGRYFLLDEIRGFAVICMVFFMPFTPALKLCR